MTRRLRAAGYLAGVCAIMALAACEDDSTGPTELRGERIYAVDASNRLVLFGSESAGSPTRRTAITGIQNGERIEGIDFRPVDGRLYAVGSSSRVYVVDTVTAVATAVGGAAFTPAVNGSAFGFDFNPVPDRIRLHSSAAQNLRLNPITGGIGVVDGTLQYAVGDPGRNVAFAITGTAYTNSVAGAATTTLYAIDSARDVLVRLAAPNDGILTTVGSLGVNTTQDVGFDIFPTTGTAYAALTTNGTSSLYTINLTTGLATLVGELRGVGPLRGIAVAR